MIGYVGDIIIISLLILWGAMSIRHIIRKRKNGCIGCCGNCSDCKKCS